MATRRASKHNQMPRTSNRGQGGSHSQLLHANQYGNQDDTRLYAPSWNGTPGTPANSAEHGMMLTRAASVMERDSLACTAPLGGGGGRGIADRSHRVTARSEDKSERPGRPPWTGRDGSRRLRCGGRLSASQARRLWRAAHKSGGRMSGQQVVRAAAGLPSTPIPNNRADRTRAVLRWVRRVMQGALCVGLRVILSAWRRLGLIGGEGRKGEGREKTARK